MTVSIARSKSSAQPDLHFLWLEITGRCQLSCEHCYADSGPLGTHGSMSVEKWINVIDQAARLGVDMVQFIGGEPTLHPGLPQLIDHSLKRELKVEVFSNLVRISDGLWKTLSQPGVRLATSYYSDSALEHEAITRRRGSYSKTRNSIREALARDIPIRVGVIGVRPGQCVNNAVQDLLDLGVADIGVDYLRQVGRGQRELQQNVSQLCGNCADGVLAIGPDGTVWPCVFSRWLTVGTVMDHSLDDVMCSKDLTLTRENLVRSFEERPADCYPSCGPSCSPCFPDTCGPCTPGCVPNTCTPQCAPQVTGFPDRRPRS